MVTTPSDDNMQHAAITLHQYECGHTEIAAIGVPQHPLCPRCDASIVARYGIMTPERRRDLWRELHSSPAAQETR
jgi:hypothetical protein